MKELTREQIERIEAWAREEYERGLMTHAEFMLILLDLFQDF